MRRSAARLCAFLLCLSGSGAALAAPASAAAATFAVQITELPGEFAAGARPEPVTVVATQRAGDNCLKVRWSMVMQVTGMRLNQVRVSRVEDDGPFPLRVQADGDTARLTDVELDPGTLCPDRTVTARYEVAVDDEVTDGTVTFLAEAYNANQQLLQRATARREVVSGQLQPSPGEPSASPSEDGDDEPAGIGDDDGGTEQSAEAAGDGIQRNTTLPTSGVNASSDSGLAKVGLAVGGVFIFLGVSLLMRLRRRGQEPDDQLGRFSAYRRRRLS